MTPTRVSRVRLSSGAQRSARPSSSVADSCPLSPPLSVELAESDRQQP